MPDETHRDEGAGDEISVGDVTSSQGIAIGRYARAIVNNVSVALGIPAWGLTAAALTLALGLMVAAALLARPDLLPRAPTPMAFAAAQTGETLVVVAKFENRGEGQTAGLDPAQRVYQALLNDLPGRSSKIRVELYPQAVSGSEAARALGKTYSATLVLWGWYDMLGITPIAEAVKVEGAESFFGPEVDISVDERFPFCVRRELPTYSSFLSLFTLGQAYFLTREGRSSDEALDLFDAAVKAAPQEPQCVTQGAAYQAVAPGWAYYYRGGVYYYRGDLDRALADANRAIELDPDYTRAYRGLATIYRAMHDPARAKATLTKGLELETDNQDKAVLYTNRAQVYAEGGDLASSLSDVDQALRLDPAYARGYTTRCKVYRLEGDLERALADCSQALTLEPDNAWTVAERGLVYKAMQEPDKALADYDRATRLDPNYAWPYNYRGILVAEKGDLDKAIGQFTRAIELFSDPKDQSTAHSNRCNAYRLMKDLDRAQADCERAVELDPDDAEARERLALVYCDKGDYARAIEQVDAAIAAEPTAERYRKRGWVHAQAGDYQAAIGDYERAIALDPRQAAAYNSLAWLYSDTLGTNLEEALELAQRAVELQPENSSYLDTLAWTYFKLGRHQEALGLYNKTIGLTPEKEPYLYRGRGHVNAELGEVSAAISDLEMYLQLEPGADDRDEIEALIGELRGK